MIAEHGAALALITFGAALVNGALGYGFSSITVPLALLFLSNRTLNPALILLEVALNAYVLWTNRAALPQVWRRVLPVTIGLAPGVLLGTLIVARVSPDWLKLVTYVLLLYRDMLAQAWDLRLVNLRAAEPSSGLWRTSTDTCCAKHKVEPLFAALESYDVWFTGLRRDQSPSRANLAEEDTFTLPGGRAIRKVSPLARWSTKEVWDYAKENGIPLQPLYDLGYTSIGCEPCTSLPIDLSNPRSGRWQGQKLECGIHLQPVESYSAVK